MARRSPLLLLLMLPALALIALYWIDDEPRAPESVANVAIPTPVSETPVVTLTAAAEPKSIPVQAGETAADRRVRVAALIEGQVTYANGAIPGGRVLVYAGLPGALWRWERAGQRLHVGLDADTLVHGFADADGRFALEWTGDRTELAVAAMAPTAATETTMRWRAADKELLTLTLEPRAALFVDVRGGAGFDAASAPSFRGAELRLRLPSASDKRASGIPAARQNMSGWVDDQGRATFLAIAVDRKFEVAYTGPPAVDALEPVPALANGEQRAMVLELAAGAHLVGRVVDELGAAVADARLLVREEDWRGRPANALTSARSDTEGRFEIQRVAHRAKSVEISKEGVVAVNHRLGVDIVGGMHRDLGALELVHAPALVGRVVAQGGAPQPGAEVRVMSTADVVTPWKDPEFATVTHADKEGNFRLHVDKPTTVSLEARANGFAPSVLLTADVPSNVTVELGLRPSLSVVGRVLDAEGQPVRGASVAKPGAYGLDGEYGRPPIGPNVALAWSDAEGRFAIVDQGAGELVLVARHPEYARSADVVVELGERRATPEIVLTLRRGASVRGVVYLKGERARAGIAILANAWLASDRRETVTDGAGAFAFERLPPGRWTFVAQTTRQTTDAREDTNSAAASRDFGGQALEVEDGAEYHVTLGSLAESPVQVRGMLRSAAQELPRCTLYFVPLRAGDREQRIARVDPSGRYEVVLRQPGSYQVLVLGGGGSGLGSRVELRCEIPAKPSHEIDLHLPGGTIRGRVLGIDGTPAPHTLVSWSREDGAAVGTLWGAGSGALVADKQGRYEIPLLGPGRYRVSAGGKHWADLPMERPTAGTSLRSRVVLRENEVREGVDVEMASPGDVHGRVRDSAGRPVSAAWIFARDASGCPIDTVSYARSDPTGRFEWRGLAPGDYTFQAKGSHLVGTESARVKVQAGAVAQVDLVVEEGAYLIVRVEGADPAELAQGLVRVDVRDAEDRQVVGLVAAENLQQHAGVSPPNELKVGPLPPGSYRASATAPGGRHAEAVVEIKAGQEERLTLRWKD